MSGKQNKNIFVLIQGHLDWLQTKTIKMVSVAKILGQLLTTPRRPAKMPTVELLDLVDFNANVANLLEDDNIVTVENTETDEYNLSPSSSDNVKELESAHPEACPEWQLGTQVVHPKWLEHHQSGHLTKDKNCQVCVEETGSGVAHWRKKGGWQKCMSTCRIRTICRWQQVLLGCRSDNWGWQGVQFLPIFVPMPKKDSVSALAALKEVLGLCQDRNLHRITGSRSGLRIWFATLFVLYFTVFGAILWFKDMIYLA